MRTGLMRVLGAVSGAALAGVDAAVLITDGREVADFGESAHRPYTPAEKAVLRAGLGCWPGAPAAQAAAELVETAYAELLVRFAPVDLIGFDGHMLARDPGGRGLHQVGSGAVLAEVLGRPVVWDFRSADVRMGGQGAPLFPFYHHALARRLGARGPVAVLQLDRRARLTWMDADFPAPELTCLTLECAPACAAPEALVRARPGLSADVGGTLPADGRIDPEAVDACFRQPELSSDLHGVPATAVAVPALDPLTDADATATLIAAIAAGVSRGIARCPVPPARIWVAGAGRHNATLMAMISDGCDVPVAPVDAAGVDGAMVKAQAIGFLAARVARGLPTTAPGTTRVPAPVGGGTLSRPGELLATPD